MGNGKSEIGNSLMGNGKWEIGNSLMGNGKSEIFKLPRKIFPVFPDEIFFTFGKIGY